MSSLPNGHALLGCLRIRLLGASFNACSAKAQLAGRRTGKLTLSRDPLSLLVEQSPS
jgi:hypothetical protein